MKREELQRQLGINCPSPEQLIKPDWENSQDYQISVKRDDLIHPLISGNKWRKLKYALTNLVESGIKEVISFGGGYSNHLHALAFACSKLNIQLMAIVRGDYSNSLTPMLNDLRIWGVKTNFVDRKTYAKRNNPDYLAGLNKSHPKAAIIPEGGSQQLAISGVAELILELQDSYDFILTPVGSGGTLAGLITAENDAKLIGIAALKGEGYLEQLVSELLPSDCSNSNWEINHDFHFGGYAKRTEALVDFCEQTSQQLKIEIEPVYSGKLFYAAKSLIAKRAFPCGSRILLIHTGGLQGNRAHNIEAP